MESTTGVTNAAPKPRNTQTRVRTTMAAFMGAGTSWARSAASERGRARNVTPKALHEAGDGQGAGNGQRHHGEGEQDAGEDVAAMAAPMSPW